MQRVAQDRDNVVLEARREEAEAAAALAAPTAEDVVGGDEFDTIMTGDADSRD
jgi:DNA-directed RNA polymerase subunit beta'